MSCPLYKKMKDNGTSFYCFPSSAEDISSAYQNENYRMYFSKFALLNLPKQHKGFGIHSDPTKFDFENSFIKANQSVATNYADQMVESLRGYVANQEVTIKESRLNNTEYFYDNNEINTTTEKIFWKWCKKLNLLDFERATPGDQYFDNLQDFQTNNLADDYHFPEILWQEREVIDYRAISFYQTGTTYSNQLEVEFQGSVNFKEGDKVVFSELTNSTLISIGLNGLTCSVLKHIPSGVTGGDKVVIDMQYTASFETETTGVAKLIYKRLVQYIGEVSGINNVQEANNSYTEVYAHIPDHTGKTPDILFRTMSDVNYKPNMAYPILPSQFQPEIVGAENFNSPIVSTPQNYPGDFYGQFDTDDYTYETSTGDSVRRSGDYYGVKGDIDDPIYNTNFLDGLTLDFDRDHYVKMNIIDNELNTFDEFNALPVHGKPPEDFEFNAILWYYTVENVVTGEITTNLYGITFLNHPNQNDAYENSLPLKGLKLPSYKKLVATDTQDGTSYAFSLNLNFNIINENPQDTYNPTAINSLFSMNLFNTAMKRLAEANNSFMRLNTDSVAISEEIYNLKGLLYTQTDFSTINSRISSVESLLNAYKTMQIVSSDTIEVETNASTSPPLLQLNSKDATYFKIDTIKTTDLYNTNGVIPLNINIPNNKNFLINIINNDQTQLSLPTDTRLTVVLDRDLDYRQSVDIIINGDDFATQNKQLDIFIKYYDGTPNGLPVETSLIDKVNLPIFYNQNTQDTSISKKWEQVKLSPPLDGTSEIRINSDVTLDIPIAITNLSNMVNPGDVFLINNFILDPSSPLDYSGQYIVKSVSATASSIKFDISDKIELVQYGISNSPYPVILHGATSSVLAAIPSLTFNKGVKFKITRIGQSDDTSIKGRYLIEKIIY